MTLSDSSTAALRQDPDLRPDRLLGLDRVPLGAFDASLREDWPRLLKLGVNRLSEHGDYATWMTSLHALRARSRVTTTLNRPAPLVAIVEGAANSGETEEFLNEEELTALRSLCPFKKGPFDLFGTSIDAEWRSDLKWARLIQHGVDLRARQVLDVGTGNGYFLFRALGEGASFVLGLEPSPFYAAQFMALSRLYGATDCALLPATSSEFTAECASFDTVLSMGVLYHRRSPFDHLMELRSFLRPGGQLVLETLVTPGPCGHALVPEGRYAQMRNVWFLPSVSTLTSWLIRLGFQDISSGPVVTTSEHEQRATEWAKGPSLRDFLDPADPALTIEGHPAPARVIITAIKPKATP